MSYRDLPPCVHGEPRGSDYCALCRAELRRLTAGMPPRHARPKPRPGVPMPAYVRQLLADLGLTSSRH